MSRFVHLLLGTALLLPLGCASDPPDEGSTPKQQTIDETSASEAPPLGSPRPKLPPEEIVDTEPEAPRRN